MRAVIASRSPPRVAVVVTSLVAALAFSGAGGCYDYSLTEEERRGTRFVPDGGDASAEPPARCVAGGYYCGGAKLDGRTDSLYRCAPDGTGVLIEQCANGCVVSPAAVDDRCSPPTRCVVGGSYCGGDKINGDPDVLYRCLTGGEIEVIQRCEGECRWNPGADDTCE